MKAGLYIVATPIGNLDDVSIRSQKTLNDVDFIICENPKHSLKLLTKLGIKKKLYTLHDHNEEKIIAILGEKIFNKSIALISDAGSPLISDPGYKLVQHYISNNLPITSIPGPSSLINALQVSGIPIDKFKYLGFVPKSKNKIENFINDLKNENQTSVFFVSSHKVTYFLEELVGKIGGRQISVCKELTKINENIFRGSGKSLLNKFKLSKKNSLGEFVITLEGNKKLNENSKKITPNVESQIKKLMKKNSLTDVVEIVHNLTNVSKKAIYKKALDLKK